MSKLVLAAVLFISIIHMVKCLQQFKLPVYFKGLTLLLAAFVIYGLIRTFLDTRVSGVASFTFLKNVSMSLLPIYSYFYYTKKGYLTELNLKLYVFAFLGVSIAEFFYEQQMRMLEALDGRTDFTNNSSYLIIGLLPLTVFLNKRLIVQYGVIAVILVFAVMGFKRGAMLVALASVLLMVWESVKKMKGGRKMLVMVFAAVVMAYVFQYAEQYVGSSDYFTYRYEKTLAGDASGREDMYPMYFNYFINQNTFSGFLFGNGLDATVFIFGNGAHNDWLEIAIDMGLLGIILYLIYWYYFTKTLRSSRKLNPVHLVLLLVFISDLLKTFFSFSIYNRPIASTCALGYCLAIIAMSQEKKILLQR